MAFSGRITARTLGLALVVLSWTGFLALTGSPEVLLFTLPVFMLTAPLAMGRYPGEGALSRIAGHGTEPKRPSADRATRLPAGHTVRAGLLVLTGFAGRAPPQTV